MLEPMNCYSKRENFEDHQTICYFCDEGDYCASCDALDWCAFTDT